MLLVLYVYTTCDKVACKMREPRRKGDRESEHKVLEQKQTKDLLVLSYILHTTRLPSVPSLTTPQTANRRSAHAPPAHEPLTNPFMHRTLRHGAHRSSRPRQTQRSRARPRGDTTCLLRVSRCSDSLSLSLSPIPLDALAYCLLPCFVSSRPADFRSALRRGTLPTWLAGWPAGCIHQGGRVNRRRTAMGEYGWIIFVVRGV
jgi:hypothetical protein